MSNYCEFVVKLKQETTYSLYKTDARSSSGFLRWTKLSEDQSRAIPGCFIFIGCWIKSYPDTKDTLFSDWLFCSPFLLFDWLITGTSRQNSRGFGETCLIPPLWGQRSQVMLARCGTLNSLEVFFSVRNTMCGGSAWLKTRNEWLSRPMRDTWEPWVTYECITSKYG